MLGYLAHLVLRRPAPSRPPGSSPRARWAHPTCEAHRAWAETGCVSAETGWRYSAETVVSAKTGWMAEDGRSKTKPEPSLAGSDVESRGWVFER